MVSEIARLWLHIVTYTKKNKYEDKHLVEEGSSKCTRQQQRHTDVERRIMDKENDSWNYNIEKEQSNGENKVSKENLAKQRRKIDKLGKTTE